LNIDEYIRLNNLTREQVRVDFREAAERSLMRALILGQIIKEEELSVTDEEIEDEISTMMLSFGAQAAMARQFLSSPEMQRSISSRLLAEKASNRLIEIAQGQGGGTALDKPKKVSRKKKNEADVAVESEDTPKAKTTRKKSAKSDAESVESGGS
jgi:trigger factor